MFRPSSSASSRSPSRAWASPSRPSWGSVMCCGGGAPYGWTEHNMSAHAAAVTIEDLSMEFVSRGQRLVALQNVDLDIAPGEFFVIVGPSGCGKTTLLRVLQGLTKATRGRILVGGKVVTGPGTDRGFVFQQDALYPWRSVLRNVGFGLELQGVAKDAAGTRARAMIDLVGLNGFESHYPHELSGGMRH